MVYGFNACMGLQFGLGHRYCNVYAMNVICALGTCGHLIQFSDIMYKDYSNQGLYTSQYAVLPIHMHELAVWSQVMHLICWSTEQPETPNVDHYYTQHLHTLKLG